MNELLPERDPVHVLRVRRGGVCVPACRGAPDTSCTWTWSGSGRSRWHERVMLLTAGYVIFWPRILPNGDTIVAKRPRRAEHPLRPRRRIEIIPESDTRLSRRIGLWFVTVRIWSKNKSRYRSQTRPQRLQILVLRRYSYYTLQNAPIYDPCAEEEERRRKKDASSSEFNRNRNRKPYPLDYARIIHIYILYVYCMYNNTTELH